MRYLVESYLPVPGKGELAQVNARTRAAAEELARAGAPVRFVESIFVPQDEMCLLVYEADSPELVREASLRAGLECQRVLEARASEEDSAQSEVVQR